jgi:O-antigen ligase
VLFACLAQAVFGVVQWSRAPFRIYGEASPFVTTPFGSYVNHNHFAGLLAMGVVLAAALAVGSARRAHGLSSSSVALAGLALALVAAQLASRSRGGLVAVAAGLAVLAAVSALGFARQAAPSRARAALAASLVTALLVFGLAAVPAATRSHLGTVVRGPSDASGSYRVDIAAATLRLAARRPIAGWGLGAYADALPPYKKGHGDVRTTHAESDVLEFLAEAGAAGLLLAGWLATAVGRGLRDRLEHGRDPLRRALALGAAAAVCALLVHSVGDFNLRLPANALVFATLLGVAAAAREERRSSGTIGPAMAATVLIALAAVAGWRALGAHELGHAQAEPRGDRRLAAADRLVAWHPYLAEGWRLRGAAWIDRGWSRPEPGTAFEWAQSDLERALRLRPAWAEAWAELGWARAGRGDRAGAVEAFDRAVSLDPTHRGIAAARAEFLARSLNP